MYNNSKINHHSSAKFPPLLNKDKYLSLKHILNAYKHYKVRFDSYLEILKIRFIFISVLLWCEGCVFFKNLVEICRIVEA